MCVVSGTVPNLESFFFSLLFLLSSNQPLSGSQRGRGLVKDGKRKKTK